MDDEAVIEGLLCKRVGTLFIPYSIEELTEMVLKLRLDMVYTRMDAARYRLARTHSYGVAEIGSKRRTVLFEERADDMLDEVYRGDDGLQH